MVLQYPLQFIAASVREVVVPEHLDHVISGSKDRVLCRRVIDEIGQVDGMDQGDEFRAVESQKVLFRRELECVGRNQKGRDGMKNAI